MSLPWKLDNPYYHMTHIVHYEYHLLIFTFTFALQFRAVKSNLHKSFGIWMHPWRIRIAKGRGNRMIKEQRDHHRNPQDLVGFVSASYFRGRSQTSFTNFVDNLFFLFFWPPIPLIWHYLPYKRWQKVDNYWLPSLCQRSLWALLRERSIFCDFFHHTVIIYYLKKVVEYLSTLVL